MREKRDWPESTAYHMLWTMVEDACLCAWETFALQKEPSHVSLHFDGLMISSGHSLWGLAFARESEGFIARSTGFQVTIAKKEHKAFLDLINEKAYASHQLDLRDGSMVDLMQDGLCIAMAIGHMTGEYASVLDSLKLMRASAEARTTPLTHTYKTWCEHFSRVGRGTRSVGNLNLVPEYGLSIPAGSDGACLGIVRP